jgi:ribosomal protein S14
MADSISANSQALRYIIRNTTLPQRVRAQAQLQLSQMHCYTRFTQVKNRCIMGGKGRGVFSDFRLGRVRHMNIWSNCGVNTAAVSISSQCPSWDHTRSKKGELVKRGTYCAMRTACVQQFRYQHRKAFRFDFCIMNVTILLHLRALDLELLPHPVAFTTYTRYKRQLPTVQTPRPT